MAQPYPTNDATRLEANATDSTTDEQQASGLGGEQLGRMLTGSAFGVAVTL